MIAVDTFFKMNRSIFGEDNTLKKTLRKFITCLDPDDAVELYGYPRDKEEFGHEEASLVAVD
jgi:hypothetical protein